MKLWDRLRALDERFVPDRSGARPPSRNRVMIAAGVVALAALGATALARQLGEPAPPLGFHCVQPAQPVVERILDLSVDGSGGVGGSASQEATAYWAAGGEQVVLVTCTSMAEGELAEAAPTEGDPGIVPGSPPLLLGDSERTGFASEVRFRHDHATVVIELSEAVGGTEARDLVTSWLEQVEVLAD